LGRGGIYLTESEALKVAGFLGMDLGALKSAFLEDAGCGVLEVGSSAGERAACLFLEGGNCRVHEVRPWVCRYWPFLNGPLTSQESFLEARDACPGLLGARYPDFLEAFRREGLPPPPRSFRKGV
jgi:Fe-S-cluster containining protein